MAQADKVLVLGALAGVGIGLAVAFYQGFRSRRRGSGPWDYLNPANAQAAGVMMANGPGLPGGQAEVLQRLEALLQCVSELKDEMKSLKNALPTLQEHVREELRGRDEARRASPLHRTTPTRRKRAAGAIAAARAGARSSEEAESEGGYMTALTDSEEEEQSDAEEEDEDEEQQPANKLCVLLERIDRLHQGSDSDKRECLDLLLEQRAEFGQNSTFLWRLIRAYCDVHDISATLEEKKTTAETGKKVGEEVVGLDPACAESHQWYAIMCGIMADYETVQNKIKNGYIFKVAQLSWIERKVAATLFGEPPSATVQDALSHFLKVEEIQPGYSKNNYVFLAKCYKDLGRREKARKMCEAASSMNTVTKEDEEAQKELELLCPALGV
uniref:Regulator of microtubule dynamics protein 2 n=1 Tax=Gasterosteus aculeatus aculeatus TaxID=481459 RepID=A0AAQ4QWC4_GASAC